MLLKKVHQRCFSNDVNIRIFSGKLYRANIINERSHSHHYLHRSGYDENVYYFKGRSQGRYTVKGGKIDERFYLLNENYHGTQINFLSTNDKIEFFSGDNYKIGLHIYMLRNNYYNKRF